ncbi:Insecticidal toxin complex protein [Lacinutrix cladophorae]
MKQFLLLIFFCTSISSSSKEWKSIQQYQKVSNKENLSKKDWLCSDRKQNTIVWQHANSFNLQNNFPEEYQTIQQRRDFYRWYYSKIENLGHEVVWPKMAYFISNKLRLTKMFPYTIFTKKSIKIYSYQGSETVFNSAFLDMKALFISDEILKGKKALLWDQAILYKEQHKWIAPIYQSMDANSLKTIERMAKGKGFYSLLLAKEIRFEGDITLASERYNYGLDILRDYCKKHYQ